MQSSSRRRFRCWRADPEVLAEAAFQRCRVHFLRNALDHLPANADDDRLQELRWLDDRRNAEEARHDLAVWIAKWCTRYLKPVEWVAETIEATLTGYLARIISTQQHRTCSNVSTRKSGFDPRRAS
jgi:transposase-like protein